MRFKKFTWNWLSFMIGFHYGRNPVNGQRFLHVAPFPFFGIDFHWPTRRLTKAEAERVWNDRVAYLESLDKRPSSRRAVRP